MSRDTRICVWVSKTERILIQKLADQKHLNLSEYLRNSALGYFTDITLEQKINLQPIIDQLQAIKAEIANLKADQPINYTPQVVDSLLQIWQQTKPKSFDQARDAIEFEWMRDYVFDALLALEERNLARISIEKEWIRWK